MTRLISAAGRALIERFEGLVLIAAPDIAGVPTEGYGHTGPDVHVGDVITREQADQLLTMDLAYASAAVDAYTRKVGATDNQFAAMVSLAFDIGVPGFAGSSVLRGHATKDRIAAGKAFLLWDKAHVDGALVEVEGLFARRVAEADLYLGDND